MRVMEKGEENGKNEKGIMKAFFSCLMDDLNAFPL